MYKHILLTVAPGHGRDLTDAFNVAKGLREDAGRVTLFSVLKALPTYIELELPMAANAA